MSTDKEERDARIASPQLRFHWDSYNIHNTYRGGLNERNNELKRDEKSSAAWVYVHIHIVLEILTNHEFHINFTFLAYALEKNGGDIFCACWTFTVNNRVHISTVKAVFDHALTSIARPLRVPQSSAWASRVFCACANYFHDAKDARMYTICACVPKCFFRI